MTNLRVAERQNWHQFVITVKLVRTVIDIDYRHRKIMFAAQWFEGGEHVFAQMAVFPAIEGQDRLTYPGHP